MYLVTKKTYLFVVLFLILSTSSGICQFSQRGGIEGFVFEATGAAVPGATVTLTNTGQPQVAKVVSEGNGHFQFSQLLAGQYRLTAELAGFDTSNSAPIAIGIGQVARYDLKLKAGSATEQVTVTSDAALLDTDRSSLGEAISARQLADLPLNGRNFTSLAALLPGVSTLPSGNLTTGGGNFQVGSNFSSGGVNYSAGGMIQGSRDNGFYLNGVNINENYISGIGYEPSPEALADAQIHVVDFSPSSGHDITSLSLQTKGGSSSFHGHVYDYIENDAFDALNPVLKAYYGAVATKPTLRRNEYGGGLGGPVFVPKVFPLRNRAFFFANYERFKESDGSQVGYTSVPSDAELNGDFSELLTGPNPHPLYNPYLTVYDGEGGYTRPVIPGNRLDQATKPDGSPLVDPLAKNILSYYPHPNVPDTPSYESNFRYIYGNGNTAYHLDTRVDVHISDKNSLFVAYSQASGHQDQSGGIFPSATLSNVDKLWLITANDAHSFSPRLTNEFIFGVGRGTLTGAKQSELDNLNSDNGVFTSRFQNVGDGFTRGFAGLFLGQYNYASLSAQPFSAQNRIFQISDNLDWTRGRHHLTFGFDFFRKGEYDWGVQRFVTYADPNISGAFTACGNTDCLYGSDATRNDGDSVADVVLGIPTLIHQRDDIQGGDDKAPELDVVFPSYGFYANDRFQISQKLSLSYGVRYDLVIPFYSNNNYCCGVYRPDANGGTIAIPGRAPGLSQHYLSAQKKNFAPRVSFTYLPDQKTVVRAGYGIFFDSGATQVSNSLSFIQNTLPGNTIGLDLSNETLGVPGGTPALTSADIFPAAPSVQLGQFPVSTGPAQGYFGDGYFQQIYYFDQESTKLPYYQRMMVDVQRALSSTSSLTVSYIGALGRHGSNFVNANLPAYQTGWQDLYTFDQARPNNAGRFGDIYVLRASLSSSYSAGVVRFEHKFSHGVQFLTSYTLGKTMSDYPFYNPLGGGLGGNGVGYQYASIRNYGEAQASHRHRLTYSGVWEPTYGRQWPAYLKAALTGWKLSGIGTMESGDHLTLANYQTSAQDFAGPDTVNRIGNPHISHGDKSFAHQFNADAFSIPDQNTRGNAALGAVEGPGQLNVDLSLAKTFNIYENLHLNIRSDFYNAFNHSQWTSVETVFPYEYNYNQQIFPGQVTGSRDARIIQLSAKVAF